MRGRPCNLSRFGIDKVVYGEQFGVCQDWLFNTAKKAPLSGTIVEIGCLNGLSSILLAKGAQGRMIRHYCIDIWTMNDGLRHEEVKREFLKTMEGFPYFLFDWDSTAAAHFFPYNSIDLVFIDGDHRGTKPLEDIKAWWPRVKDGGIFSGHDAHEPSVSGALKEFFGFKYNSAGIWALKRESACNWKSINPPKVWGKREDI